MCCVIGIILNSSSLVLIFHFLLFFFIPSMSLSTFYSIVNLDFLSDVITWSISSSYIEFNHQYSSEGNSFVKSVYREGDRTLPCGTPLINIISRLYPLPWFIFCPSVVQEVPWDSFLGWQKDQILAVYISARYAKAFATFHKTIYIYFQKDHWQWLNWFLLLLVMCLCMFWSRAVFLLQ